MAKTFWLTGLSGAGKSTLAWELRALLVSRGAPSCMLDGDVVRSGLCSDLDYTPAGRSENIRRIAEVAKLCNHSGVHAIVAAISPYRDDRARANQIVGTSAFIEIFVSTTLATCARRDPKGLYARAATGALNQFTGVSAPYEAPLRPSLDVCTDGRSIADCRQELQALVERALFSGAETAWQEVSRESIGGFSSCIP